MSTSGIVIPHLRCQSPNPQEIHCFKWKFCVRCAWLSQKYSLGVKWDLLAFQDKNFVMCCETFSENETCSETGSPYFQTVLWNKTRQTGGEKKTKFPKHAGSEGHNARMTNAVIRDTIKNILWSIPMTEWNMASVSMQWNITRHLNL